jgi:hypothetical protein
MDESAYREARDSAVPLPCVFEKALLAGCADCTMAIRRALAEREAMACASPVARGDCVTLQAIARERSTFALKLGAANAPLPHAVAMKLQCGGLAGLRAAMAADDADVHGMVVAAQRRFGGLADLPWQDIVRAVAAWQGRRRRRPDAPR